MSAKNSELESALIEIYKLIADTRKFEIDNFWKRILFFWGTLAIILVGYAQIDKNFEPYSIFISFLGVVYTLIFSLSIRGSKFWHINWELKSQNYSKRLIEIFKDNVRVQYKVEISKLTDKSKREEFLNNKLSELFNVFDNPLHKDIFDKEKNDFALFKSYRYSPSKLPILLSDITLLVMLFLLIKDSIQLYSSVDWCFDSDKYLHINAASFTLIAILAIAYIVVFIRNEVKRNKSEMN